MPGLDELVGGVEQGLALLAGGQVHHEDLPREEGLVLAERVVDRVQLSRRRLELPGAADVARGVLGDARRHADGHLEPAGHLAHLKLSDNSLK